MTANNELFGAVIEYPNDGAARRFGALVGLDNVKARLVNEAAILIDPTVLQKWSLEHHGSNLNAVAAVIERTPLFVFSGDVGTGKTELAESIGDPIARRLNLPLVTLYPLSLTARGRGLVGQMTTLITQAFEVVGSAVASARDRQGQIKHAAILLIDEADALAQSRESEQMHHEDRAGVNALIRSLDGFRRDGLPVLTILCTNRGDALDPAILRRAAHVFCFERPGLEQRLEVLSVALEGTGVDLNSLQKASATLGATGHRRCGATYSDLRQRFIPELVLAAFERNEPVTSEAVVAAANVFLPTRPFGASHD